ncbi:endocytosis defective- protein [Podochytrium sp. JEL0797]|nr:endocytosis defective- protein [Podochytrium sp. JEL0797]
MSQFDWYVTPSDRFQYESKFSKFCNDEDEVALSQLEPLFQTSYLSQEEFAQIWTVISLGAPTINQEQFIYFQHVLACRRKGKPLPIGIPMHIKEGFLKAKPESKMFTRYVPQTRDLAAATWKDASQLHQEIQIVQKGLLTLEDDRIAAESKLASLTDTSDEMNGLAGYKRNHLSSVRDDVGMLRDSLKLLSEEKGKVTGGGGGGMEAEKQREVDSIVEKLMAEKSRLEAKKRALQTQI